MVVGDDKDGMLCGDDDVGMLSGDDDDGMVVGDAATPAAWSMLRLHLRFGVQGSLCGVGGHGTDEHRRFRV